MFTSNVASCSQNLLLKVVEHEVRAKGTKRLVGRRHKADQLPKADRNCLS